MDPSQVTSHGSKYLDWTTQYISAYKMNQPIPGGLTGYQEMQVRVSYEYRCYDV